MKSVKMQVWTLKEAIDNTEEVRFSLDLEKWALSSVLFFKKSMKTLISKVFEYIYILKNNEMIPNVATN